MTKAATNESAAATLSRDGRPNPGLSKRSNDSASCRTLGGGADTERIEAALRFSEQRFRDFAAASSDWFWECDATLRFTWFSESAETLCGVSVQRLIGRTRRDLGLGFGDDAAIEAHMAELRTHRPFRDFRYRTQTDRGEQVWFSISGVPVFDASGGFQGYRGQPATLRRKS
ncbi:MAG: PAS domain-containing protein [Rhodospirillales bacterium]|nr:PAS domain-containing protein [Rhodospirillales bacterium]